MKFVDSVRLRVKGGDGGNGAVAFRRETFIPFGGPAGGDGGKGGSVVFVGDEGRTSLLDLVHLPLLEAKRGEHGRGKDQYGKAAVDFIVKVPIGTEVYDVATGEKIADLSAHNERKIVAQGGLGGRGNIHFATAFDRAPRRAEPGSAGEERSLRLELKVIADVGLLGFPNVGKSTLVATMSRARPKIADYPFTTLQPHLGVVRIGGRASTATFVLADIPGLIPGASSGAGLGIRFLKHVERCRALLHLIAPETDETRSEGREPLADYDALMAELEAYAPGLAEKARQGAMIVAMSKGDIPETHASFEKARAQFAKRKILLRLISAATGDGLELLGRDLYWMVRGRRPEIDDAEAAPVADAPADAAFEVAIAEQRAAATKKKKKKPAAKGKARSSAAAKGKSAGKQKASGVEKPARKAKPAAKALAKPKPQTKSKLKEKKKAADAKSSVSSKPAKSKRAGGTRKQTNTKADAAARARKTAKRKVKRAR